LFELLVVIAIIGVLAAVAVPRFADFRAAAYDARSQQDLRNLASAQELYRAANTSYATDLALLDTFRTSDGVDVAITTADASRFAATASHDAGQNDYAWDSDAQPPMTVTPRS
jgi:type II secretory pathway pseudopilin PulG